MHTGYKSQSIIADDHSRIILSPLCDDAETGEPVEYCNVSNLKDDYINANYIKVCHASLKIA